MNTNFPDKIQVQVTKAHWFKRSYQFIADAKTIGQIRYTKSFKRQADVSIDGRDFSIRRRGIFKHYVEITSSYQPYNMRIDINWRGKMKITDADQNPYVFKSTSISRNKWAWLDRYERPVIEIKSKIFSRKNRGLIDIKYHEMKDPAFWLMVAWFVILCSESDNAVAASAA